MSLEAITLYSDTYEIWDLMIGPRDELRAVAGSDSAVQPLADLVVCLEANVGPCESWGNDPNLAIVRMKRTLHPSWYFMDRRNYLEAIEEGRIDPLPEYQELDDDYGIKDPEVTDPFFEPDPVDSHSVVEGAAAPRPSSGAGMAIGVALLVGLVGIAVVKSFD